MVKVRVIIGNRIEFVLFPRTLASSPHVFTKLADWHRALLILNASVIRRNELVYSRYYEESS